jgi:hypothetical protein
MLPEIGWCRPHGGAACTEQAAIAWVFFLSLLWLGLLGQTDEPLRCYIVNRSLVSLEKFETFHLLMC